MDTVEAVDIEWVGRSLAIKGPTRSPSGLTLEELAGELGISHQAA